METTEKIFLDSNESVNINVGSDGYLIIQNLYRGSLLWQINDSSDESSFHRMGYLDTIKVDFDITIKLNEQYIDQDGYVVISK